jgi:hypothetical protein
MTLFGRPGRLGRWLTLFVLIAVAILAWQTRRRFIRTWFADGAPGPAPLLTTAAKSAPGLSPVERVRVLLVDGLTAATARQLAGMNGLCQAGLDLVVDVGFPTVSLPVQAVLWTGKTQQQSGILYRIPALPNPPEGAAPVLLSGSRAVLESDPHIAGSFGFTELVPRSVLGPAAVPRPASDADFAVTAEQAVAGPDRLVFVHVLRVDKAGHKGGTHGSAYRSTVAWADALLVRLLTAAPPGKTTRWFVLSDHGHRPNGGHGGSEASVRLVRACVAGGPSLLSPAPAESMGGNLIHLVDLSRALFDSLGLGPAPGSAGRPLGHALAHPDEGATLPRPSRGRALVGVLILAASLFLTVGGLGWRPALGWLPWWLPVAYGSVLVMRGLPTLSNPMVYPPLGRDMILAALPGLLVLMVVAARAALRAGNRLPRLYGAQMALPVGAAAASLTVCGGIEALFGIANGPPLLPFFTAHASLLLALLAASALTMAATLLVTVTVSTVSARILRRPAP